MLQYLIIQREGQKIKLARPVNLTINEIVSIIGTHFNAKYRYEGVSRLPSLSIYAIYQCLVGEVGRYSDKELLAIESHTSADQRTGRIGDIDIVDKEGNAFEGVEIKFNIPISLQMVKDAYTKFKTTPVRRYYILSTADISESDKSQIIDEIAKIREIHGCHVIVNGIIPTIKYYLRMLNDPSSFINKYVSLVELDKAVKFEHKEKWNEILSQRHSS
jgi:DNA (cytosine-5)-methyltransferase 1